MFGQVEAAFAGWMADARAQAAAAGLPAAVAQLQSVAATLKRDVAEGQRALVRMASSGGGTGGGGGGAGGGGSAPAQDPRQRIAALVTARDYDGAFNAALSAASPELLLWACRQVSPAALAAAEPPALSQACLLSLVQQLGANLGPGPDAELRLEWLTEVAPLLEPGNPVIAAHLRGVLSAVMGHLKALAGQLPHTDAVGRKAKLTIHVVNSLLHQ
jgi:enhancer of mRNA-decapping protein 4